MKANETMKKMMLIIFALVALIGQAEVVITEIMPDNGGKYPNAAGEPMDWLELYNPCETPVDLTGWRITDTVEDKWSKWKEIPAGTTVPAQGYLLLWGHNKDFPTPEDAKGFCGVTNGEVHVKLGMSSKGETITLAASEADYEAKTFADQVTFDAQFADVSYGRDPNDTAKWLFFTNATPGAANGTDGLEKYPPEGASGEGPGGDEDVDGPHEGEFAIVLDVSRPVAGKAMRATVTGGRTGNVVFAWSLRKPMGEYGDTVCKGREYTPIAADYEHWVRVVAKDETGKEVSKQFYFSKLPIVYIDTDDGKPVTVKTEYKDATIRIQGNDLYDQQYEGKTEIKGRGNSSWGFPKKPYKLKLNKKADMFGFGKNKHWVLLSNWLDECFLRNYLAQDLAGTLGLVKDEMTWVNVIFNGEYQGNYMFGEHIRVDENRINIFDWSDIIEGDGHTEDDLAWLDEEDGIDVSGGYIFELSNEYDEVSKFTTAKGLKVMINTPEYAATSKKMMDYVADIWNGLEDAYCSEDGYNVNGIHYSELSDIHSMISYWLVMEMLGNDDAIYKSRYAHKDKAGKIVWGPAWDFDWGCGSTVVESTRGGAGWKLVYNKANFFLEWLDDPYFCLKAVESYADYARPWFAQLLQETGTYDHVEEYLHEAGARDDELWGPTYGENRFFKNIGKSQRGFEGDVRVFREYLRSRVEWLDVQFVSVDKLMASVRTLTSAIPYVKDDIRLSITLSNGSEFQGTGAKTDFVLNWGENAPQVRVAVSDGAVVRLNAYVNGLKYGIYDVADGKCEFTVSADKLVAERGHRDMVSLIAKDADGKTVARNYLTILNPPIPQVTVTEIMADNGGSLLTADGKAEDWIELYNPGSTDADISGWRLCDSTTKKWSKWEELPEGTVVPAGGYLIVWADDFTGWTNGEVHVNLGFSSKGEEVALAIAEGEIVDSIAFGPQHTDVSFGRDPSDPEKLVYFRTSTPGAVNGNDGVENGDCFSISINEQMAENGGKFPNAAGEAMDWLELYNAGAADVDVSGWGFQDDPTKAWSKWKTLPEGAVVPAGGYLLVWGDNKDFNSFTGFTNDEVHVNMGLSKKGEGLHLALTNGVGTVVRIDGFEFPKQAPDVSWGRTASDPDKFLYFTEPTPAAANGDDGRKALLFTIDFDSNGGSPVVSVTNDYDAAISAPESTRTGYAFGGWYESGAAEPFAFSTMPARDVALTARWTANSYAVVYDPNGGEGASVTNGATYDAPFEVGSCGFARTGYAFAGWTTNLDAAAEFAPGAAVSNLTAEAGAMVTLYATWETNAYTLVYAADNGTGASVSTNLTYDAEHVVLTNPFAKAGHSFVSWTNEAGVAYLPGQTVTNLAAEVGATVVWTAAWTANVYAVSFDSNGGSAVGPLVADYGAAISAPEAPVRTGYAFAGWYESGAAEPFAFSTMPARDVALTARWTANEYTVVYDPNGGAGAMEPMDFTYDVEKPLASNAYSKVGYTFAGWAREAATGMSPPRLADGEVVSNLTAEAGATVTLYAVWERVGVAAGETKTVVDEVTGEEKTVVVLPETEPEFTGEAAAVYDGFVMSAAGEVVGTVQVKAAKANKKSGISTLTATVQIVGEKKLSFKGGEWGPGSEYAEMALKDGRVLTVAIGANGLVGTFGEYEINGSANIFSSKDKETKAFVKAIEDAWVGAVNVVGDGVVLSVAIAKKGKVKVSGTVNGVTVSATSQLLIGEEVCCIPVVITKKASLAFNLWLNADGSVEIAGLDGAAAGKAGTLKSGAAFRMDGAALERALPGLLADYLPDGLAVGLNKTKWIVAPDEKGKAAKAGKVVLNKKTGEIDETKLGANPAALKLTYKAKDGSFKGSFKAYTLDAKGKIKSYTVNVTGVMVGDVGYGTATLKKPAYTLVVAIE